MSSGLNRFQIGRDMQGLVFGLLAVFAICFWLNMRAIPADGDSLDSRAAVRLWE